MEKRTRLGTTGLTISGGGLLLALAAVLLSGGSNPLPPLLLLGAAMYLIGGFMTVFFLGYRAGSRSFLIQRIMRLAFAAIVIFSILRGAGPS